MNLGAVGAAGRMHVNAAAAARESLPPDDGGYLGQVPPAAGEPEGWIGQVPVYPPRPEGGCHCPCGANPPAEPAPGTHPWDRDWGPGRVEGGPVWGAG